MDCILIHISNPFNFFESLVIIFNKHGYNFDDVRKMATLGCFKIKVFQNKYYDVIISVHDVTNKILLRYSSYTVAAAM